MERFCDEASREQLRETLEYLYDKYDRPEFVEADPISIPHAFTRLEDKEIAGFLAAAIAWGNRKVIVRSGRKMMDYLDNEPYDFVCNASPAELARLQTFVHRTFNGQDFTDFIMGLRGVCRKWGSVGEMFQSLYEQNGDMTKVLSAVRREFFVCEHNSHSERHFSSIDKGAACKRLNMYLRWFVRRDGRGVDFGEWTRIPMSALYLPLDVHSGNMGRALGLLRRKQSDWKATAEITAALREFDADDPVRYDFSLFGAGIDGYLKQ